MTVENNQGYSPYVLEIEIVDTPPAFIGFKNDSIISKSSLRVREKYTYTFPDNIENIENQTLSIRLTDQRTNSFVAISIDQT